MEHEVTAEELAKRDERDVTIDDWVEDLRWLDEHGYKIVRKEN